MIGPWKTMTPSSKKDSNNLNLFIIIIISFFKQTKKPTFLSFSEERLKSGNAGFSPRGQKHWLCRNHPIFSSKEENVF